METHPVENACRTKVGTISIVPISWANQPAQPSEGVISEGEGEDRFGGVLHPSISLCRADCPSPHCAAGVDVLVANLLSSSSSQTPPRPIVDEEDLFNIVVEPVLVAVVVVPLPTASRGCVPICKYVSPGPVRRSGEVSGWTTTIFNPI